MKKLILSLFLILSSAPVLAEEKVEFKHPFFYQRLTDVCDDTVYILTPNSKFFEISFPLINDKDGNDLGYGEVDCTLLENEEKFIKMKCNDCTDFSCKKHQERINTFEILDYNEKTDKYYMKHKVIDINDGSVLRENLLWLDTIMAIHPYDE